MLDGKFILITGSLKEEQHHLFIVNFTIMLQFDKFSIKLYKWFAHLINVCTTYLFFIHLFIYFPFLFYRRIYPQSLLPLQNTLKTLHLHGNEWVCDCKLQPFREWVIEKKLFNRPTQCMEPARLNGKMWNEIQKQDFACKPEVSFLF